MDRIELRRWLVKGLARRWLWLQLAACAVLVALCGVDVIMVLGHVSCSVYRRTVQGVPGEVVAISSLAVGVGSFFWRVLAQILSRQYRAVAWSLGILALEGALVVSALEIDIDKTLFYCAFEGVSINPCELGMCAR